MVSRRMVLGASLGLAGSWGLSAVVQAAEDDVIWQDSFPTAGTGGRPTGWTGTVTWLADGNDDPGALQTSDASATAYTSCVSPWITVGASQYLVLAAMSRSASTGTPTILVEEFDAANARVATSWLNLDTEGETWAEYRTTWRSAPTTTRLRLQLYAAGRQGVDRTGTLTVDRIAVLEGSAPPNTVIDGWGHPVPVSDVVDIIDPLTPEEFWAKVPAAPYDSDTAARSLWSLPLLRRHFLTVNTALPAATHALHAGMPVLDHTLGAQVDIDDPAQRQVVAGDIPHRPVMTAHPWTTATYSDRYYPRRMGDFLLNDFQPAFLPATALSADPRLAARRDEILAYLHFSQFTEDGGNGFTEQYFPDWHAEALASGLTRRWAGGWDYLFDWEWPDAYGYRWQLHEPDHHVGSQMAQSMVRAFEQTGDRSHLEAARRFVWNQFPRYGFHSGVWEGRRYQRTEYNPTGPDEPVRDATDNVVALCSVAAAMVGHHLDDRRMLEFARGMLWYCVREWTTDGRWYYDGAENPLNGRRAVSHDMAVLPQVMTTIAYLTASGVPLDREIDVVTEAYEFYLVNYAYEPMAHVRYGQLVKLDPAPSPRSDGQRLVSFLTANQTASSFTFADGQPEAAGHRGRLRLVASVLQPPASAGGRWRPTPGRTAEREVFAADLTRGVALPLATAPGDLVRLVVDHRPAGSVALTPSTIDYVDSSSTARHLTAIVSDPAFPTTVTEETFVAKATLTTFATGADLDSRVRPA